MSATSPSTGTAAPSPQGPTVPGLPQGRQFLGLLGREILKTFRNPLVLAITILQPFMWLAFFGSSFGTVPLPELEALLHTQIQSYLQYLLPGVLATSMLAIGMFGSMSTIQDKRFGFMKRILITPTSKATVYLSKALGSATRGVVGIPVMVVAGLAFGVQYSGDPLQWAGWILCLVLLGLGFSCMFLAITASSTDWQTPGVISNFITMPLMFASGAMFPTSNFPSWMQTIAEFNPVTYCAEFGRGVVLNGQANWAYLGYVALFSAAMVSIGTLVASRYLKAE
jgi:ABC-2 type transport system permease protein